MPHFCSSNHLHHHHHQKKKKKKKKKKISTVEEIWCKCFWLCLTCLKLQEAWLKWAHHHSSGRDPTTQKSPQNQKQIKSTRPRSVLCGQEAHSNNKHGANRKTISKMFMNKTLLTHQKEKKNPTIPSLSIIPIIAILFAESSREFLSFHACNCWRSCKDTSWIQERDASCAYDQGIHTWQTNPSYFLLLLLEDDDDD